MITGKELVKWRGIDAVHSAILITIQTLTFMTIPCTIVSMSGVLDHNCSLILQYPCIALVHIKPERITEEPKLADLTYALKWHLYV